MEIFVHDFFHQVPANADEYVVQQIADHNGFINHGPVGSLKDLYHFQHDSVAEGSR